MDLYFLALSSVGDLGPVTVRRLLATFGSAEAVFGAHVKDLMSVEKVGEKRAQAIKAFRGFDELEIKLRALEDSGVRVLAEHSDGFPPQLRETPDPPLVIYLKGEIIKEDRFAIAIVGSRDSTRYGVSVAGSMASELASAGFTIISGLARGIDTAAHMGAVTSGGRTGAVLGSGIDVPYPPENKGLMERIARDGFVISEYPPGTEPSAGNFPRRNRIISGLSMGVLVVEAADGSGALITAAHALEQGKEVFSVPGNINSVVSKGTNSLIRKGAKAVLSHQDIIEELAPLLKGFIKSKEKVRPDVTGDERAICDMLSGEPAHIDDISRESGLPASKALALLLGLELKGVVRQTEGKRFHLT